MPDLLVFLFVLLPVGDTGARAPKDIAVVADRQVCEVIAGEMNKSPRKSKDVTFGCREGRPAVQS